MSIYSDHSHYINDVCRRVHEANAKWWVNIHQCVKCGNPNSDRCVNSGEHVHPKIERNVGELLMLSVSELAEAMEGHRKGLQDDKLPHRTMFEVEIADCIIRLFDIAGGLGLDLGAAFEEKMAYNSEREDHKIEARLRPDGKKY